LPARPLANARLETGEATTYPLYLESGPKRRKTMVHILDLPGCVAVGPTTDEALQATPQAIGAYRRFLKRHGQPADPEAPFQTAIAEHITEGMWLGNGSPYLMFAPDFAPVSEAEIQTHVHRFEWMREDLANWAATQSDALLGASGSYLASALGGAPGFSKIAASASRGEMPLPDALRQTVPLARERLRATTSRERAEVRQLPAGPRTLRKALRRMLEHDWEHLAELSRRPGGPRL